MESGLTICRERAASFAAVTVVDPHDAISGY
jgi:hypothetical protein